MGVLVVGWLRLCTVVLSLALCVDVAVLVPLPLRSDTARAVGCEFVVVCVDAYLKFVYRLHEHKNLHV